MLPLILLFTVVPAAELYLLFKVADLWGGAETLLICVVTGIVGARLARAQGVQVLRRIQETTSRGELPTREIVDAVLILVAGVVLLTPGFFTDAMGLLLLLPPSRAVFRGLLQGWIQGRLVAQASGQGTAWTFTSRASGRAPQGWEGTRGPDVLPPTAAPSAPSAPGPVIVDAEIVDPADPEG